MSKAKICALIGSIMYTVLSLIGAFFFFVLLVLWETGGLEDSLSLRGVSGNYLLEVLGISFMLVLAMMIVNWVAFVRLDKPNSRGWRIYLLVIGIFYGLASVFNGLALIVTLPISFCFILAFVFGQREK